MIEFERPKSKTPTLSMTSMMDIIFLLLLFFLLTAVFADPGIPVNLPEASTATMPEEQAEQTIYITRFGEIYLNSQPVTIEDLSGILTERFRSQPVRQVTIKADKEVAFGLFVKVMDLAKAAGGENLTIAAQFPE